MTDYSEFKHTRAKIEHNQALEAQDKARKQDAEKIKNGARFVRGPLRSYILKKQK